MADFVHKYPYTNFEELNLDWILENEKKQNEAIDAVVENDRRQDTEITTIKGDITAINGQIEDINGDIAGINSRLDEVDDNIGDLVEQDTHLEGLVNSANQNAQTAIDKATQANNNASTVYNAVNTLQSKHNSDVSRLEAQIASLSGGIVPEFYKPNILFNCDDFTMSEIPLYHTVHNTDYPIGLGWYKVNSWGNLQFRLRTGQGLKPAGNGKALLIPISNSINLADTISTDNPITLTLQTTDGVKTGKFEASSDTLSFEMTDTTINISIITIDSNMTYNTTYGGVPQLPNGSCALVFRHTESSSNVLIQTIKAEFAGYFTGFSPMPFEEYLRMYYTLIDVNQAITDATAITETAITGGEVRFGFYRRPAEATEETQPIYWTCKGYYVRQFNEVNVHLDVCYANYTDPYAVTVTTPIYEIAGDLVLGDGNNKFILPQPKSELLPAYSLVSCYGVPVQTSLDTIVNDLVKSWVSINLSGECYLFTVIKPGALLYNQDSPDNTNPGAPTFTYDFNYICR